ncbi:MAG TPA: TIGR03435 family protein [Candidatus Limnocylindrales bacterium]|nr:TIGR03435 family protein [Candidatus Limnocylindrales bacterium]
MKAWIAIIGCFAAVAALAQEGPRFEVASGKPHSAEGGMNAMPQALVRMMATRGCVLPKNTPGRWQSNGMPLSYLVACAYGVKAFQVTAAPWMESEGYDIVAKMPADTDEAQFRLMLRNLLAERFHLAVHQDSKEMQTYRLTAPKGAAKLSPAKDPDPRLSDPAQRDAAMKALMEQSRAMVRAQAGGGGGGGSRRSFTMQKATMAQFADNLTSNLDAPVTDETAIEGEYSFVLSWSPDGDGSGLTIAEALQQQLGLKLEQQKAPVTIVVIDRADKVPVEN